jgi:hypothetical protein
MKFYLPKSFTDLVRTAAKLDPTAKPFVPETTGGPDNDRAAAEIRDAVPPTTETETNPNFAIYNNGVPALTPNSLKDVLDGIGDEALDENFGPDALDAAELEMVDHYVNELATIDLLEDREVKFQRDCSFAHWIHTHDNTSFSLSSSFNVVGIHY